DLRENLDAFRLGFDSLLRELDDRLDEAVFGRSLPLVGTQLAETVDLFEQIRAKVSDNLDLISSNPATDVLTPGEVRQALFDALGPGGLGWLQDLDGDGQLNALDDVVVSDGAGGPPTAADVVFEIMLAV
ncbi:MAG: hypothetical protein GWN07_37795, partial [Actinobacteria bacterium]|nr:hypothetical protein [Actinomycetota bacterium]NIX25249.1 hypothetical protein [Actinomycetota bacterium]